MITGRFTRHLLRLALPVTGTLGCAAVTTLAASATRPDPAGRVWLAVAIVGAAAGGLCFSGIALHQGDRGEEDVSQSSDYQGEELKDHADYRSPGVGWGLPGGIPDLQQPAIPPEPRRVARVRGGRHRAGPGSGDYGSAE